MKNRIYILLGVICSVAMVGVWLGQPTQAYPSSEGLVLRLDMDDNLATTNVIDSSVEGNHGTFNDANGDSNTDAHSEVSLHQRALSFDGTDDYVDCGNDSSLNITDTITKRYFEKLYYKIII